MRLHPPPTKTLSQIQSLAYIYSSQLHSCTHMHIKYCYKLYRHIWKSGRKKTELTALSHHQSQPSFGTPLWGLQYWAATHVIELIMSIMVSSLRQALHLNSLNLLPQLFAIHQILNSKTGRNQLKFDWQQHNMIHIPMLDCNMDRDGAQNCTTFQSTL